MTLSMRSLAVAVCAGAIVTGVSASVRQARKLCSPSDAADRISALRCSRRTWTTPVRWPSVQGTIFVGSQYAGKVHAVVRC